MRVTTSLLPELDRIEPGTDAVAVIDVLRATTVMTTALEAGARELFTCADVAQARTLADSMAVRPLLCGERECRPIAGFDLGNSPSDYTPQRVGDRSLVLSTTNGTRALMSVRQAPEIFAASFANLSAVARLLSRHDCVHLVCAGTDRTITAEDILLAGAILTELDRIQATTFTNDSCRLALRYWQSLTHGLSGADHLTAVETRVGEELLTSLGGRNLVAAGYESDIADCARIDRTAIVPRCISRDPLCFAPLTG